MPRPLSRLQLRGRCKHGLLQAPRTNYHNCTVTTHTHLLRNTPDKESAVVHTHADPQRTSLADFVVVQDSNWILRLQWIAVHHERIPTILSTEVHHEPHLIDASDLLEHGHQLVFEAIPRNLADEYFASPRWGRSVPVWWGAIATLAVLLHNAVARARHELRYGRRGILQRTVRPFRWGFLARGLGEGRFSGRRLARLALLLLIHTERDTHTQRQGRTQGQDGQETTH